MLHYEAIDNVSLDILKKLMQLNELNDFYLVGGTALALLLGHRFSIDLALFTGKDFTTRELTETLQKHFTVQITGEFHNTLNLFLETIKVDLISFKYPLLKPIQTVDGIRLMGLEDICSMKLSAIAQRGSKKDFFDLYFLLEKFTLDEIFQNFQKKFPGTDLFHIIKSLTYFEDADPEPDPVLVKKVDWAKVKKELQRIVRML